jgi:Asp-tRNA(Asn)/Glu-tRNA(Gln) amidotransferase A subunit family amidase
VPDASERSRRHVADLARQLRDGALTAADLVQRYLDRIAAAEPAVMAWRELRARPRTRTPSVSTSRRAGGG